MIGRTQRLLTYMALLLLFVSGTAHFVLHDYFPSRGPFGPGPNPWEPWLLRLHGAAAMWTLVILGMALPGHVARFWRMARNRLAGFVLLASMAVLIGTGYGLYYFSGDGLRAVTRQSHIAVGLLALPAFMAHLWRGIASRPRRHSHRSGVPPAQSTKRRWGLAPGRRKPVRPMQR